MTTPTHRSAVAITALYTIHLLFTAILTLALLHQNHQQHRSPKDNDQLTTLATTLGILAAILTTLQYLPQLFTTFRLRAAGSLSIPMMLIQTPGSFVWAASLAARTGTGRQGWSAWGVYVVSGSLQGVLLAMALWFEVGNWRARARGEGGESEEERGKRLRRERERERGRVRRGGEGEEEEGQSGLDERLIYMVDEDGERTPLLGNGGQLASVSE